MQLNQITEMSETDLTSEPRPSKILQPLQENLTLDELFAELSKETKKDTEENIDEFAKIQKELDNLPKIESNLETNMAQAEKDARIRLDVVKINDPITHIKKADKKAAEEEDSGSKWFNMKKPEMTPELKRDLLILKNRSALDPKRHYKKEKWLVPKYFQTGTIIEGNTEFYSARLSRKNRGKTLAQEILNDDESSKYFRRKYYEIQKERTSGGKKHYKKIKEKRRGF